MDIDNNNEVNTEESNEDKIKSFHEFGLDDRILKVWIFFFFTLTFIIYAIEYLFSKELTLI